MPAPSHRFNQLLPTSETEIRSHHHKLVSTSSQPTSIPPSLIFHCTRGFSGTSTARDSPTQTSHRPLNLSLSEEEPTPHQLPCNLSGGVHVWVLQWNYPKSDPGRVTVSRFNQKTRTTGRSLSIHSIYQPVGYARVYMYPNTHMHVRAYHRCLWTPEYLHKGNFYRESPLNNCWSFSLRCVLASGAGA